MGYRRISLSKPYSDVRRISPDFYMSGLGSVFVGDALVRSKGVEDVYRIVSSQLQSYLSLRLSSSFSESGIVCCAVSLPTLAISVNHRELMRVCSSWFSLEFVECRGSMSRNARLFDLRGPEASILAFIPVYSYLVQVYDILTRRHIKNMGGSRFDKFAWRATFTSEFIRRLQELGFNILGC